MYIDAILGKTVGTIHDFRHDPFSITTELWNFDDKPSMILCRIRLCYVAYIIEDTEYDHNCYPALPENERNGYHKDFSKQYTIVRSISKPSHTDRGERVAP